MSSQTQELDRFMNNIRVRTPGALDDAIKLELFNTLDKFCKETNIWRERIPIAVVSDTVEYEIEPEDANATIVRLMFVQQDGFSQPVNAYLQLPDVLVFHTQPSTSSTYTATVALTVALPTDPRDGLPEFPTWFFNQYSDELTDGVLSRMMSQANKPYFSPQGMALHGARFRGAMSRIRGEVDRGHTFGTQTWRFPRFGR